MLVQIAEMVLAELAGGIALVLQQLGDGDDLVGHADRRAGNADLRQSGAIDALSGDERRATRGAGLLAVGIGEHHALLGDAIDVRRLVAHQAVRVATQIRNADVVAPDDEDVRLVRFGHFLLLLSFNQNLEPIGSNANSRPNHRPDNSGDADDRQNARRFLSLRRALRVKHRRRPDRIAKDAERTAELDRRRDRPAKRTHDLRRGFGSRR